MKRWRDDSTACFPFVARTGQQSGSEPVVEQVVVQRLGDILRASGEENLTDDESYVGEDLCDYLEVLGSVKNQRGPDEEPDANHRFVGIFSAKAQKCLEMF